MYNLFTSILLNNKTYLATSIISKEFLELDSFDALEFRRIKTSVYKRNKDFFGNQRQALM